MNQFIFLANIGSDLGDLAQQTAKTFAVDWPHLVAQIISFSIVCVLLYFFAYKRVLAMLEERRQRIAEGLANAERIKAELARTEEQRQEVLRQANEHANGLIEEARAAAARVREQETQKAMTAAEEIITKAREAASLERLRMLADVKREVGRLVVETTSRVTGKVLTPDDQRRLAEETSRELAA